MKHKPFFSVMVIALALIVSACAPAKADPAMMEKPTAAMAAEDPMMEETPDAMMEEPTAEMMAETHTADGMMAEETPAADMMMEETATADGMMAETKEDAMMDSPAWLSAQLGDVSSGETFTLSDFKGKVVLVELMAQWCSTCKKQQMEVKALHEQLGMPDNLAIVVLDIDPNENAETLKTYAEMNGFAWMYAVSPADVSREIGQLYGNQFLNPPSAPMLIVDAEGAVHPLPTGLKSADDLKEALDPYLNGM